MPADPRARTWIAYPASDDDAISVTNTPNEAERWKAAGYVVQGPLVPVDHALAAPVDGQDAIERAQRAHRAACDGAPWMRLSDREYRAILDTASSPVVDGQVDERRWVCITCSGGGAIEVVPASERDRIAASLADADEALRTIEPIAAEAIRCQAERDRLAGEVERLREDMTTFGAALVALYVQALNGVVCDPTDGHRRCKPCGEAWNSATRLLIKYDQSWGNGYRSGAGFQPNFDLAPASDETERST